MAMERKSKHSLKVIGVGLGRTGTESLQYVLEELGFGPCYHGKNIYNTRSHLDFWEKIENTIDPKDVNWNDIFYNYQSNPNDPKIIYNSSVDWPASRYWNYLADFYPQAKIILTIRDPNKWFKSCCNTIFARRVWYDPIWQLLSLFEDEFTKRRDIWRDNTFCKPFGGADNFDQRKEMAINAFNKHTQNVQDYNSIKDRLFIIDWERKDIKKMFDELCQFLNVEQRLLNEKNINGFPWLNDTKSMNRAINGQRIRRLISIPQIQAVVVVIIVLLIYCACFTLSI